MYGLKSDVFKMSKKKKDQLGLPFGTASNRLRKLVLFSLVKRCGLDRCHQCGGTIESADELSIEHKTPYLDSEDPARLFFDIDNNIAFSHLKCNSDAGRPVNPIVHPSVRSYTERGCRCDECRKLKSEYAKKWRKNKKLP